jgi:transposase
MRIFAATINLSGAEKQILIDIMKGHSSRKNHIQRARMILHCAKGVENSVAARALNENKQTVGKWRKRWAQAAIQLEKIQLRQDKTMTLKAKILEILSDAPRAGGPTKFTAEQLCQIYAVATEKPEDSEIPLSHWSLEALATEIVKRGIVESISTTKLNIFLKSRVTQAT